MNTRSKLKTAVNKAIKNLQKQGDLPLLFLPSVKVERPLRQGQGDYSVAVAMQLASTMQRKPKTIAKLIQKELVKDESLKKITSSVQVASPGFVNFYLSKSHVRNAIWDNFTKKSNKANKKTKKVNLEFGSINPTGQLHIGHARTFFYGDVLANILEQQGYKVVREYYINNAKQSSQIKELGKTVLKKGTSYKSPYLDKKIKEFSPQIKRFKNPAAAGYFIANKIQKDNKEILTKKTKIKFDVWFEEENLYKKDEIKKTINKLKKKGLTYEKDGAVWLKTTRYGDSQDQVIVRSSGEYTYFISDIAYHLNKAKRRFDKLIDIWGADHHGHLLRMKATMKMFGIKNLEILIGQLARIKGGERLSKRKGNIITVEDLIDEVGLDAVRFFYLTKSLDSQMEFDINLAKKQSQKNPVFYIQYTHARCCSIMRRANKPAGKAKHDTELKKSDLDALKSEGEMDLIKKLLIFGEITKDITEDYQVHRLTNYTLELAQQFNQFYRDFRVIGEEENKSNARLMLVAATANTLKQCLDLLGIKSPAKM